MTHRQASILSVRHTGNDRGGSEAILRLTCLRLPCYHDRTRSVWPSHTRLEAGRNMIPCNWCGRGSAVEHRLPKPRIAGSNPVVRSILCPCRCGSVVEQLTRNEQVVGSNPTIGSRKESWFIWGFLSFCPGTVAMSSGHLIYRRIHPYTPASVSSRGPARASARSTTAPCS